jgi:C4-dicarboxylate-specific signal transduction histidine kinase
MTLSRIASKTPLLAAPATSGRPRTIHYSLAFVTVAAACVATYVIDLAAFEGPNLLLFFVAIALAAWFGGPGPGWLSVVLSVLAVDFFFSPPLYVLDLSAKDIPWFIAFALCAMAVNAVSLQRRRMEAMLRQAHDKLEQRVQERTLDLQQSNDKLTAMTIERAVAEAALRETQHELARVARIMTVSELTASIAHEVSQPLAAVMANSEAALNWLKRSPPDLSQTAESIAAVTTAGQRASDVISRIRTLMTKGMPTVVAVDVNGLVENVLALVGSGLEKRNVAVMCRLETKPPLMLGDTIQLQQLLLNLVNNAAEAMVDVFDRKRELTIETRQSAINKLTIAVHDTGHGLAKVDATKLFQPFYSTKPSGMGMGLSICCTIVDFHKGTIRAVPRSPHGTTFEVELPLRTAA